MDLSPALFSNSKTLYCAEDAASWNAGGEDSSDESAPSIDLTVLLLAETEHMPRYDYSSRFHPRSLEATVRQDCINWILKVIKNYRFRPVTAYLSVNYLDSFLSASSFLSPQDQTRHRGWPMQLLSVACLSIAAKMEETDVPLLLDLQILEPKFVFEPRTVRRMELALMAALHWRMRSITPFDFLPSFTATILTCTAASRTALFSRAADLIISTRRVVDFLKFRPSVIAAAAVLMAAKELSDLPATDHGDCLCCFSEWVSKEALQTCCQLMEQYIIDNCPSARWSTSMETTSPHSPVGILDAAACGSCDSHNSSGTGIISGELQPLKRRRRNVATPSLYRACLDFS